jgi:hypothetical protein
LITRRSPAIEYVALLLAEIVGIILIFWDGIPIFRHLIRFEQIATASDHTLLVIAAILVQFSYWICLRHDPPFAVPRQQFIAHVLLFVSRLVFIFASTFFSLVVYRYSDVFDLSLLRVLLMMAVLFSVFCFTRHLEKLGTLMNMASVPSRQI